MIYHPDHPFLGMKEGICPSDMMTGTSGEAVTNIGLFLSGLVTNVNIAFAGRSPGFYLF